MYAYVDSGNRLLAVNPNDMSGNTGWQEVANCPGVDDRLTDDHGAALYKVVNGQCVARTEEERQADWPDDPVPVPTLEERVTMCEECIMEMSEEVYK